MAVGKINKDMAQLIPARVKVVTKEGEVELHLTIDLNINLSTGDFQITNVKNKEDTPKNLTEDDAGSEIKFEIPKFESKEKVKFGIKGD